MQAEPAQPSETITKSNSTWRDQSSSQTATCSSGIAKTITVVVATTVVTATMMATVLEGSQQATKAGPGCGNRDYFTCTIETCASEPFKTRICHIIINHTDKRIFAPPSLPGGELKLFSSRFCKFYSRMRFDMLDCTDPSFTPEEKL